MNTLMEPSMRFTLPRTVHAIAELGVADALEGTSRRRRLQHIYSGIDGSLIGLFG